MGGPRLQGTGERGGYSPADLRDAYNLPSAGGAGLTIAITIAFDYPKAESDLAHYRETYGLPPCTAANGCFEKVNQHGEAGNYPQAAEGWSAEAALDLDMASASCSECRLLLVEADDNTFENLAAAVAKAAELDADVISNSWGGREFAEETSLDHYFTHPGIPVLFASGDSGHRAEYPAASQNVIAVGGTTLRKDPGARGWRESAWIGAGSACSGYEEKPAWQTDSACARRSIADVSAVADPRTPVSVYDTYGYEHEGWELFGGTSAAAPILAGVEALSSAADRAKGAQLFWEEGPGGELFDPGEGRNGPCHGEAEYLCLARLGYDGPTGWGTPGGSRPGSPDVATYDPTAVNTTEATLHGAVNPNAQDTSYRFEYGRLGPYTASIPIPDGSLTGSDPVDVAVRLSGLVRGARYHYRLVATNASGTTYGGDQTFETSLWSVRYMPRKEQREEMFGISCPSTSDCVAVGSQGVYYEPPTLYYNNEPLVQRWNGSDWAREAVPLYHPPARGYSSSLAAVSCTEPDFCMAVGTNYELGVGFQPLVERWDGSEWSIVPAPRPGQGDVRLHGVSCASETFCVLAGESYNDSGEVETLVEAWDGSSWSLQPSPNPPGHRRRILWGVSCASAAFCVAVGQSEEPTGGEMSTLIERWDGTQWSIETAPILSGGFQGVSCPSTAWCMAVGGDEGRSGGGGRAEMFSRGEWTEVALGNPMRGISCRSWDWCTAVGGSTSAQADFAALWNGARWVLDWPVAPRDKSDQPQEMYGVSCEVASCMAVGWYWSWGYRPLAESLDRSLLSPLPSVENDPVGSVSRTAAELRGHVDNEGAFGGSDCRFEVAPRSAPGDPVAEPACNPRRIEGDTNVAVDAEASGLDPNTEYVYRVVASDEAGARKAAPDSEFATPPSPPAVSNLRASSVSQTTATLNAHVNNEGAAGGSICRFVVALESSPASPVAEPACDPSPVEGGVSVAVQAEATGLAPDTAYVYWVVATSAGGSSTAGPGRSFSTLPNPPAADTDAATSITQTTAVLNGHVDNEGAAGGSSCKFVVALADAPSTSLLEAPCSPSPVVGSASIAVEASLSGLSANTEYVYRIVAENEGGMTTSAPDRQFQTLRGLPAASFSVSSASPRANQAVFFDASSSSDPEDTITDYEWDFGDGENGSGSAPLHVYLRPGAYTVTLRVRARGGLSGATQRTVTVGPAADWFALRRIVRGCDDGIILLLHASGPGAFHGRARVSIQPQAELSRRAYRTPGRRRSSCGASRQGADQAERQRARRSRQRRRNIGHGQAHGGFRYGSGFVNTTGAGNVRLAIMPRRAALRALRRHPHRRWRVHIAITFESRGANARTKHAAVLLGDVTARRHTSAAANQRRTIPRH